MTIKLLNYRGVKKKGQVSWTVYLAFIVIFIFLFITIFSGIKTLFGLTILGSFVFAFCYLMFNKHPVHMMLIAKAYLRESVMSPTPIDTYKVNGLREIKSLNEVLNKLNKNKKQ